jgi:hypothetical protein
MFARTSHNRAREFAAHNFAICSVHQAEAFSVHETLQCLCNRELSTVEPAKLVCEILPAPTTLPPSVSETGSGFDSLDRIELAVAFEEERRAMSDHEMDKAIKDFLKTEHVFNSLLGSVASATTWDPATIWFRSIRTIVNERVRHRGGCTCE